MKTVLSDSDVKGSYSVCDGGIYCPYSSMTAYNALRIGECAAETVISRTGIIKDSGRTVGILVQADTKQKTAVIASSVVNGIISRGADVIKFGYGFEAQACFAAVKYRTALMIFIGMNRINGKNESDSAENEMYITFFDSTGLYPGRIFEREMNSLYEKSGPAEYHENGVCRQAGGLDMLYGAFLKSCTDEFCDSKPLCGFDVLLNDSLPSKLVCRVMNEMSGRARVSHYEDCSPCGKCGKNNNLNENLLSDKNPEYRYRLDFSDDGREVSLSQYAFDDEKYEKRICSADLWHILAVLENEHCMDFCPTVHCRTLRRI